MRHPVYRNNIGKFFISIILLKHDIWWKISIDDNNNVSEGFRRRPSFAVLCFEMFCYKFKWSLAQAKIDYLYRVTHNFFGLGNWLKILFEAQLLNAEMYEDRFGSFIPHWWVSIKHKCSWGCYVQKCLSVTYF